MDNGQHANNPKDPFAEGITAGVGTLPEMMNQSSDVDLNTINFDENNQDNLSERGSTTLDAMGPPTDKTELTLSLANQSASQLGQVVDLTTPPQTHPSNEVKPNLQQEDTSLDSTIAQHIAGGKLGEGDVSYLKNKTEDLVNDPAKLGEFVMKARRAITNRLPGDSK